MAEGQRRSSHATLIPVNLNAVRQWKGAKHVTSTQLFERHWHLVDHFPDVLRCQPRVVVTLVAEAMHEFNDIGVIDVSRLVSEPGIFFDDFRRSESRRELHNGPNPQDIVLLTTQIIMACQRPLTNEIGQDERLVV